MSKAKLYLTVECRECGLDYTNLLNSADGEKWKQEATSKACDGCGEALEVPQILLLHKPVAEPKGGDQQ